MKRPLLVSLSVFAAFLIDMKLSFFGFRTDLTSFVVYWFGFSHSYLGGMLFGAAVGGIEDSLLSVVIGSALFGKAVAGFFASFLSKGFFRWTPVLGFFGAMGLTFLAGLMELVSIIVFEKAPDVLSLGSLKLLVFQALLNGVLGFIIKPEIDEL
ncbi:MAG: hypothetical protein M0Z59_05310 [Nitrospiraceae bacterium]|nr:hypothetical protein [Nitrospiraceae bacterium]